MKRDLIGSLGLESEPVCWLMTRGLTPVAAGKTTVRRDALAHIAQAVKLIWEQPEAAHGDGCRPLHQPTKMKCYLIARFWKNGSKPLKVAEVGRSMKRAEL